MKLLHLLRGIAAATALTVAANTYAAPAYSITPADGAEVESLSSISIAYASGTAVTIVNQSDILIMNLDNGESYEYSVSINPRNANVVAIQLDKTITDEVNVNLFIPSGTFSVSGEDSGEIDVIYTIKKEDIPEPEPDPLPDPVDPLEVITVSPAPGVVTSVGSWELMISSEFALENRNAKFTVECSNPNVTIPTIKNRATLTGASIYFDDDAVLTEPGTYTLTIPAGRYAVGPEGVEVLNPEMKFEYIIEGGEDPKTDVESLITMDPAPGVVTSVGAWELKIASEFALEDRTAKFTLECSNPDVTIPAVKSRNTQTGASIYLDNDAELTTPGTYTLTVPAGRYAIGAEGEEVLNPEMKFEYVIKNDSELENIYKGTMTVDPAEGMVDEIDMFTVKFDADVTIADASKVTVTGPDGEVPTYVDVTDNYLQVFITNDEYLLSEPGKYTLAIAEGAVTIEGKVNPAVTYSYEIAGDQPVPPLPSYTVSPAPGSYTSIADGISISFSTEETIVVDTKAFSLTGPDGDVKIFVQAPNRISPKIVIAPIDENDDVIPLNQPGEYVLTINAKGITVNDAYNAEPIVLNYTIKESDVEGWNGEYTADPADDSEVDSLSQIAVTFVGAKSVMASNTAGPNDFPALYNNDGVKVTGAVGHITDNVLYLTLNQEITAAGYYTLVIPAAFLKVNGESLTEPLYVAYTIKEKQVDVNYNYEFSPADKIIDPLASIYLTFSGEGLTEVTHNSMAWGANAPKFSNDEGKYIPSFTIKKVTNFTFLWTNTWPFKEEGEYTFNIPAEYFTLTFEDGTVVKNPAFSEVFTVKTSGIDNIVDGEAAAADVYNAQGMLLIKDATAEQINALAPGLYIIGGVKVLK